MRIGVGFDVHRFGGAGPLRIGGVDIPHDAGLAGHSDGDVLLHAVADAIFGAMGVPDIGEQFPPGHPKYRNADSSLFLRTAAAQAKQRGWRVVNVDATVIADAPKLTGYKRRIADRIGALLGVGASRISVKAKTTEGLLLTGGGIAAHVVVLLAVARPLRGGASTGARRRTRA